MIIDYSCVSYFAKGKCPKGRYNSRHCPFNCVPSGNQYCIYSGNNPKPAKLGEEKS